MENKDEKTIYIDELNKYYKLKNKYEEKYQEQINSISKQKISLREKRSKIKQIKRTMDFIRLHLRVALVLVNTTF